MPPLVKGQHAPLNVTQQLNHRIFVGLGWDPVVEAGMKEKLREMVGGKKSYHDLDLSCYLFGPDMEYIDLISGKGGKVVDESGRVYHSGDSVEGVGDGDDEQISVELLKLPETIHHIVFKVSIETGHGFDEVDSPEVRIVDGYSQHCFLERNLHDDDAEKRNGYVFVEIYRSAEQGGSGWNIQFIDEFVDWDKPDSWERGLKAYLTT